jgi:hypothetical protein
VQAIPNETLPLVFRLLGMGDAGGGPKVTSPFKFLYVNRKEALRSHLERLAACLVSHDWSPATGHLQRRMLPAP